MSHRIIRLFLISILMIGLVAVKAPSTARAAGPWYVATTGDDNNDCLSPSTPCATINGTLAKPGFVAGDTIRVAIGTYIGTGNEVVLLDKSATLAGGWNASFTTQSGMSTIDGQSSRIGITVDAGLTGFIERFVVQHGSSNGPSGIYNGGSTLTIKESLISANTSIGGGAGIGNVLGGVLTLNASTVSDNTASFGGGIANTTNSTMTVNNSTISGNRANSRGGGIYNAHGGTLFLNNATISGNSSEFSPGGGGIYNESGSITLSNSIVAGNMNAQNDGADCLGTINSAGYNLIGQISTCNFISTASDLTYIDPLLGSLQDNGGLTFTHALLPGSPAIDAGNPAGCTDQNGNLLTDQRGIARPQGTRCDIGAFELEAVNPVIEIHVDIMPGSAINLINIRGTGIIPVSILSTATFNAPAIVNKTSLTFGKTGNEASLSHCLTKQSPDVNGDGRPDLVCYFRVGMTGLAPGDTQAIIRGQTMNGTPFEGMDSVKVTGSKNH